MVEVSAFCSWTHLHMQLWYAWYSLVAIPDGFLGLFWAHRNVYHEIRHWITSWLVLVPCKSVAWKLIRYATQKKTCTRKYFWILFNRESGLHLRYVTLSRSSLGNYCIDFNAICTKLIVIKFAVHLWCSCIDSRCQKHRHCALVSEVCGLLCVGASGLGWYT